PRRPRPTRRPNRSPSSRRTSLRERCRERRPCDGPESWAGNRGEAGRAESAWRAPFVSGSRRVVFEPSRQSRSLFIFVAYLKIRGFAAFCFVPPLFSSEQQYVRRKTARNAQQPGRARGASVRA